MTKETIKNIVSLFLHCQKLIPNPKRLHFNDLKSLLNPVIDENEFNGMVKSVFTLADHYFLLEKYKHPTALLVDINILASKLKPSLNPCQKMIFITVLLRLAKVNNEQSNDLLDKALYCVAEIFSFNQAQTDSIKKLFLVEKPGQSDYHDSILLTNVAPNYTEVIDGFKVIYNPSFPFRVWVKNVKSVNNMLFKVLEFNNIDNIWGISAGDVLTYNRTLQSILEREGVTLELLSSRIISNASTLPRVEIPATERSPRVILNGTENRIEIEGVSMTFQPDNFFEPVFYWLKKIKDHNPRNLSLHFNLSFFNTYASKIILKIIQEALVLESKNCKVKIYWYHENDDDEIKEAGEHYASIVNKDFIFVSTMPADLISA